MTVAVKNDPPQKYFLYGLHAQSYNRKAETLDPAALV